MGVDPEAQAQQHPLDSCFIPERECGKPGRIQGDKAAGNFGLAAELTPRRVTPLEALRRTARAENYQTKLAVTTLASTQSLPVTGRKEAQHSQTQKNSQVDIWMEKDFISSKKRAKTDP